MSPWPKLADSREEWEEMSKSTDTELVEAACKGSLSSFEDLYRRHYAAAVGIAYCVVGDRQLAEDAAQEAFAVACRDLPRLRHPDRFVSWLGTICRREAIRAAKSRFRHRLPDDTPARAESNGNEERRLVVRQSVHQLPESARQVIVLRYFSELSYQQIAEFLDISPQAVHGRLIRAKRMLSDDLRRNSLVGREP